MKQIQLIISREIDWVLLDKYTRTKKAMCNSPPHFSTAPVIPNIKQIQLILYREIDRALLDEYTTTKKVMCNSSPHLSTAPVIPKIWGKNNLFYLEK